MGEVSNNDEVLKERKFTILVTFLLPFVVVVNNKQWSRTDKMELNFLLQLPLRLLQYARVRYLGPIGLFSLISAIALLLCPRSIKPCLHAT